mmetsp:Transcript_163646/g.314331  ORF Transcript_163646/g.314331 Transcript_163646/m.314331 type:complete len:580 (-) Transcript_163646:226-1965(-)
MRLEEEQMHAMRAEEEQKKALKALEDERMRLEEEQKHAMEAAEAESAERMRWEEEQKKKVQAELQQAQEEMKTCSEEAATPKTEIIEDSDDDPDVALLGPRLPEPMEETSEISAGEAQLVTLARALLRSALVDVMDEPTARVDPLTDAKANTDDGTYEPGAYVLVHDFEQEPRLNGTVGSIVAASSQQNDHCSVCFGIGSQRVVRRECLQGISQTPLSKLLAPGVKVIIHGLTQATALNGLAGTLVGKHEDRYNVQLPGHGEKAVKEAHLSLELLAPRVRVMAHSLVRASHLNGEVGVVVGREGDRYEVKFQAHGHKALQADNLCLVGELASTVPLTVAVVAPGAGTGRNASVYKNLTEDQAFEVEVWGKSGATYDRYPAGWPTGAEAPNLESFGLQVLSQGILPRCDCLIFGSRGGQVVLPSFWQERGSDVPPAIVINGGCASPSVCRLWPDEAVVFLLIGGKDYFSGGADAEKYMQSTKHCVPPASTTCAILFIREMEHMPQSSLLTSIIGHIIRALVNWKSSRVAPKQNFNEMMDALSTGAWSGCFSYTDKPQSWVDLEFPKSSNISPMSPSFGGA